MRVFVLDRQAELARKAMADGDMNLILGPDHKPARHVTGYFNLREVFRAAIINVGDEQQDQIVSDQTPFDSRRAPGEDQRQNAEREKNEESTSEDHGLRGLPSWSGTRSRVLSRALFKRVYG